MYVYYHRNYVKGGGSGIFTYKTKIIQNIVQKLYKLYTKVKVFGYGGRGVIVKDDFFLTLSHLRQSHFAVRRGRIQTSNSKQWPAFLRRNFVHFLTSLTDEHVYLRNKFIHSDREMKTSQNLELCTRSMNWRFRQIKCSGQPRKYFVIFFLLNSFF